MLFNSIHFLIFFPTVVIIYYSIPHRYRWAMLLAASYYFYASWRVEYLGLIILSTVVDYWAALRMSALSTRKERQPYLILSILVNVGILVAFKYFNFFNDSFRFLSDQINFPFIIPYLDVLLPVGISFYTFQTMGYSIDVYRGQKEPEKHLGIFALYVSFFPQLVAGPIERSRHLLPQFHIEHKFDYDRITSGLRRMMWGFFKKVVIADRLALYVDAVYQDPDLSSGQAVILATYFFAFQVYCDFSGYTDIALGSAQVMGFDLMENFKRPFFSKSIPEFWQRWHISLFSWFRDYIYIPLGGSRVVKWRWYFNIFVVFFIAGIWHGADWTFIAWGVLSGLIVIGSIATYNFRQYLWNLFEKWIFNPFRNLYENLKGSNSSIDITQLKNFLGIILTFHLFLVSLFVFRANKLSDVPILIERIFATKFTLVGIEQGWYTEQLMFSVFLIVLLMVIEYLQPKYSIENIFKSLPSLVRWAFYYFAIMFILLLGEFGAKEFFYFQF